MFIFKTFIHTTFRTQILIRVAPTERVGIPIGQKSSGFRNASTLKAVIMHDNPYRCSYQQEQTVAAITEFSMAPFSPIQQQ